jgi:hypothetical protein
MRGEEFTEGQLWHPQQMAEVSEAPAIGEAADHLIIAWEDLIQAQWRARRERMPYPPRLFPAHDHNRHLDGDDTTLAIVADDLITYTLCRDELPHQPIILDANVMDDAQHLQVGRQRRPHKSAKGGHIRHPHAAAGHEARSPGTQ